MPSITETRCRHAHHYAGVARNATSAEAIMQDLPQIALAERTIRTGMCDLEFIMPEDLMPLVRYNETLPVLRFAELPLAQRLTTETTPDEFDSLVEQYLQERFHPAITLETPGAESLRDLILYMAAFAPASPSGFATFDGAAIHAMAHDNVQDVRNIPLFTNILVDCDVIAPAYQREITTFDVASAISEFAQMGRTEFLTFVGGLNEEERQFLFESLATVTELAYGMRFYITTEVKDKLEGVLMRYEE